MPISPPTIALSFGSFGDIVAILQLAWQLRAALDECSGASVEIQALICDVDAFTRALQDVQANIERRRRSLRPDVLNGIAALSRCRDILRAIQQRIDRARRQTSDSGWHKYWGTAAWSILGGKKDIEALRARLSEQLGTIQLYLSLSQANSQERVQDALAGHGTTLQRIYTIVQDIQLRFDVGVPGFRFYDSHTQQYHLPLARTSLQRLRDVHEALRDADEDLASVLCNTYGITADDFSHRSELSTRVSLSINTAGRENPVNSRIYCFFFREAAFGEWQVLVSAISVPEQELCEVLTVLLERTHTVGADCTCAVSCSTRYRGLVDEMIWRRATSKLYAEVAATIFEHLQPQSIHPGWFDTLCHSLHECPDPEQLRSVVLPALRRQQLSADQMVELIATAHKHSQWADRFIYYGRHKLGFSVAGGALTELLVGYAFPASVERSRHDARYPEWGCVTFTEPPAGAAAWFALRFGINVNSVCRYFTAL